MNKQEKALADKAVELLAGFMSKLYEIEQKSEYDLGQQVAGLMVADMMQVCKDEIEREAWLKEVMRIARRHFAYVEYVVAARKELQ